MKLYILPIFAIIMLCTNAAQGFTPKIYELHDASTDTMQVLYSDMLQLRENVLQLGSEKLAQEMIADECIDKLNYCELEAEGCLNTVFYEADSGNNYYLPWYVWLGVGIGPSIAIGASLEDIMIGQGFDKRYIVYGAIGMAAGVVVGYGIDRLVDVIMEGD